MESLHRGFYMSAHVLLNLLKELGEKIRCEALPSIFSVFPIEFNKFNNARFCLSYDTKIYIVLPLYMINTG